MSATAVEDQPWSRAHWGLAIGIAVAVQLVLTFVFSQRPSSNPRPVAEAHVILPEHVATELQELTDPTLFARGGPRNSSATWLELPLLPPVDTAWEQPPEWLALDAATLGQDFLNLARSKESSPNNPFYKAASKPALASVLASPMPVRTASKLQTVGDVADRLLLSSPELPSWPAKAMLLPSEVRVVVDTRGRVTSAILVSPSGSEKADQFAISEARKMRFAPVSRETGIPAVTLGQLVFRWHTIPEMDASQPVRSE